jgi:hypothetical protein
VSQTYFETHFGIINPDGSVNKSQDVTISSNVVSVLQAGAFFGALGSAPISGRRRDAFCACADMGSIFSTLWTSKDSRRVYPHVLRRCRECGLAT